MRQKKVKGWWTVWRGIRHYTAADGTVTVYIRKQTRGGT